MFTIHQIVTIIIFTGRMEGGPEAKMGCRLCALARAALRREITPFVYRPRVHSQGGCKKKLKQKRVSSGDGSIRWTPVNQEKKSDKTTCKIGVWTAWPRPEKVVNFRVQCRGANGRERLAEARY